MIATDAKQNDSDTVLSVADAQNVARQFGYSVPAYDHSLSQQLSEETCFYF